MVLHSSPVRIMKLALLVTEDGEEHGGEEVVADTIKQRFYEIAGDGLIEISEYFVVKGKFPKLDEDYFDGFIITGSHHSVNEDTDWIQKMQEFIVNLYNMPNGPKLVGICFGHQLIAKAFGGKVGMNPNGKFIWCSGHVRVSQKFSQKKYFKEVWCENADHVHIMQSHYEQILEMPLNGLTVGSSEDCENEMILYGEDRILTMQGHPEVTVNKMVNFSLPILKSTGQINKEEEKLARDSFRNENGDALVRLIINFFNP